MSIKGRVLKSAGGDYWVQADEMIYKCRLKGNLRLRDYKFTNPVVVGDIVHLESAEGNEAVISEIEARSNYIIRKSVNLSKQAHILASNIDQAILVATLKEPKTYPEFIDRYLVTAEAYHIPAVLIFNKTDLYDEADLAKLKELTELYRNIGYSCYEMSAIEDDVTELKALFKDKITLLSGYSGVGKSTLINRLDPDLELKTQEVSESYSSGTHTTTFAEMHEIRDIGFIIDTPGIKGLGVLDIQKEELSHYFLEMRELLPNCKFNNCTHIDEPKCAVKNALDEGLIHPSRYKSYLGIFYDEDSRYR